ncbi:MAG: OmpA-like transrane domain protein, partial [Hyphomicrobiales bacterium]|nr:OmpA-like transrane domain protein [Hyphomicrobiales bacterium]
GAPGSFYGVSNGNNDAAFTGGAQAGYNMQFGAFVAGVEADINYIDRNKGSNGIIPNTVAAGTYYTVNRGNSSNYFGTVRGRLGYAFDRALIYVTGGLAYGGNGGSGTVYSNDVVTAPFAVTSTPVAYTGGNSSSIGWTLGGGLEYAFSNAWSVKAEYLHVDLGSNSRTFLTPVGGGATTAVVLRNENKFDIVRAGLNYRF